MTDTAEVNRIIRTHLTDEFCESYIEIGSEKTTISKSYENFAEAIENFEIRDDDIWVTSYPKTGTTWTQEMVWLIANNLDFERAQVPLDARFPFLECCAVYDYNKLQQLVPDAKIPEYVGRSIEYAANRVSPRFLKTHMPFCLLPKEIRHASKTPKIIYVFRNPKDVCVSYYHYGLIFQGWNADIKDFSKVFLAEKVMYGSYWKHVLGYWNQQNLHNLLLITYEDMKNDLRSVIEKVAKFLDKELSEDQIHQLLKHLDFNSMKNNRAVNKQDTVDDRRKHNLVFGNNNFIRSGTVGKYKEELTSEIIENFDTYTKSYVSGTNFEKQFGYIL